MTLVTLEYQDDFALISVDNPPVNALSTAIRAGLDECIVKANEHPRANAIILYCKGRTFIAGADIREIGKPLQAPFLPDVIARIEACDKPVIAAIHGSGLGGGLEVAMGCHYRVASDSAKLGLPEVKLGLLPGATGTQRLPRLVGVKLALDMMLSGSPITASEAKDSGLIDAIVDDDDLLPGAIRFAKSVMGSTPRKVSELPVAQTDSDVFIAARQTIEKTSRGLLSPEKIIECVEAATSMNFEDGCSRERELFMTCKESAQANGLMHAFFAHRAIGKIPGIDKNTDSRNIENIAILGAGTMGAGIAYCCLTAGYNVYLLDNDEAGLQRGRDNIQALFNGGVKRGKLSPGQAESGLARFTTGIEYSALSNMDLVIEAVFENMAVKKEVFAKLDQVCPEGCILATNTSTLDVDEIAAVTNRPDDVIGLHFFSPAHIMRLLEIVRGAKTSVEVLATSLRLGNRLRKTCVVVGNCYGFVGNRMLHCYGRENQFLLLEGASPEYIDTVLTEWGMAMGPNAVGDLAGLDVGYKSREGRTDLSSDPKFYRISDMLVEQGRYGQKTGQGIFRYEKGSRVPIPDEEVQAMIVKESARLGIERRDISAEEVIERCIYSLILEGARILEDRKALRASDIDVVWINGYGFPAFRGGPMHFADTCGIDNVLRKIDEFKSKLGAEFWTPPKLLIELAESGSTFAEYDEKNS